MCVLTVPLLVLVLSRLLCCLTGFLRGEEGEMYEEAAFSDIRVG